MNINPFGKVIKADTWIIGALSTQGDSVFAWRGGRGPQILISAILSFIFNFLSGVFLWGLKKVMKSLQGEGGRAQRLN